jgi:hypothetical protein
MTSLRFLTAAAALFTLTYAQTQCPAGIPNVQADANGVLYALVQTGFPHTNEIPHSIQSSTLSQIGCAAMCDTTPDCIGSSYIPDNRSGIPECAFFAAGAKFQNPDQPMQFFSAISCAYLVQNPAAYPPPLSASISTVVVRATPTPTVA